MSEPRVIIAMAHTSDYTPLAELTVPTVARYCERWGYDLYYHPSWEDRFENDGDRMKVRIFKELYEQNLIDNRWDVFVWIDSDAMVMNSERSINMILDEAMANERHHFLWAYDIAGPNTGVYIARFTWQAHMFLHESFCRSVEMGWGDNTAMIQIALLSPYRDWILEIPGRYMNAYPYELYGWQKYNEIGDWKTARDLGHDWILHLPGIETHPNPEHPDRPNRMALVQEYLKVAK